MRASPFDPRMLLRLLSARVRRARQARELAEEISFHVELLTRDGVAGGLSGDYFDLLGAHAVLGRALRASDDVRGAAPVAVLGYSAWQRRFNGDPGVLGRQLRMYDDGIDYTIVGVMPRGLDYPGHTELWAPITPALSPAVLSSIPLIDVVGRLRKGSTPATEADREGAPAVVVLSESAARHYWPGRDPIGKHLRMRTGSDSMRALTVVGVVPDTRYRSPRDARPSLYFPLRQSAFPFAPLTLAIRTTGAPEAMVPVIRRVIGESVSGVALANAAPFESYLGEVLAQPRLNALLLAASAPLAAQSSFTCASSLRTSGCRCTRYHHIAPSPRMLPA